MQWTLFSRHFFMEILKVSGIVRMQRTLFSRHNLWCLGKCLKWPIYCPLQRNCERVHIHCPYTGSSSKMQICMEGISAGGAQVQLNCTRSAKPSTPWTVSQWSANSCSELWRQCVFGNEIAAYCLYIKLIVHACQKYICLFHIKVLVICWQQHRDKYGHVL